MRKFFKNGIFIVLVFSLLVGQWGCASSEPSAPSSYSFPASSPQGENKMSESQMNKILEKEGLLEEAYTYMTPSSILSAESDSIWYLVSEEDFDKGKDGKVSTIYVFNNGKCSRYPVDGDYTLGELAKMSDEEILSALKSTNLFGTSAQSVIEADIIAEYAQKIKTAGKVTLSNKYEIDCDVTMPDTSERDVDSGYYNIRNQDRTLRKRSRCARIYWQKPSCKLCRVCLQNASYPKIDRQVHQQENQLG